MGVELVTVGIVYYRPDYRLLLNELWWQTDDFVPELPRVHRFLNFWRTNIDATIAEIQWTSASAHEWRHLPTGEPHGDRQ